MAINDRGQHTMAIQSWFWVHAIYIMKHHRLTGCHIVYMGKLLASFGLTHQWAKGFNLLTLSIVHLKTGYQPGDLLWEKGSTQDFASILHGCCNVNPSHLFLCCLLPLIPVPATLHIQSTFTKINFNDFEQKSPSPLATKWITKARIQIRHKVDNVR